MLMHIGLDFDNTIVNYDTVFYKVAEEHVTLPLDLAMNKLAVRNYLHSIGKESLWTEIQGYVYGKNMHNAAPYPGVIDFIQKAVHAEHTVTIISHKTRHPYRGVKYELHEAAESWIAHHLSHQGVSLVTTFFEETKEKKLNRILAQACDVFIDDLPEILLSPSFPKGTRPVLFDPQHCYEEHKKMGMLIFSIWDQLKQSIL